MENLLHGVISNGEHEEDGHAIALLGMTDVAAATSSLPMVAAISLGFSISVLLDPEREAFDGDPLTALETLALSVATALSVYTITFSLLEFYYIHLVAGAACLEDATQIVRATPKGCQVRRQLLLPQPEVMHDVRPIIAP